MNKNRLNPCIECINALRHNLFKLKTNAIDKNGTSVNILSYNDASDAIKKMGFDLYAYKKLNSTELSKSNIEHIIPAYIYAPTMKNCYDDPHGLINEYEKEYCNRRHYRYINTEPYTDLHILTITNQK